MTYRHLCLIDIITLDTNLLNKYAQHNASLRRLRLLPYIIFIIEYIYLICDLHLLDK